MTVKIAEICRYIYHWWSVFDTLSKSFQYVDIAHMSVSCSACINKHLEHRLCTHNCSACVYIATSVRADKCHLLDLTSPTDCQYLKLNQLLYKVYTLHFVCKYCILQCTLSIECPPANCLFKNSHQPNCSCVMSIYLIDCLQNRVIDKHKTIQPLFHMWSL